MYDLLCWLAGVTSAVQVQVVTSNRVCVHAGAGGSCRGSACPGPNLRLLQLGGLPLVWCPQLSVCWRSGVAVRNLEYFVVSTKASINFGFFEIELFPDGLGWGEGVPEQHLHAPECEAQVKSRSVNTQTTVTFRRDYNVPSFAPPPPAMVSEVEVDKSLMQQS